MPPDELLIEVYTRLNVSADRIATDAELRAQFLTQLPAEYRGRNEQIPKRLINLRKKKKLPKLRK